MPTSQSSSPPGAGRTETDALIAAVRRGKTSECRRHLLAGVSVEGSDDSGTTPLIAAIQSNRFTTTQILLEAGADTEQADTCGKTALHHAVEGQNARLMQLLIAWGADVTQRVQSPKVKSIPPAADPSADPLAVPLPDSLTLGSSGTISRTQNHEGWGVLHLATRWPWESAQESLKCARMLGMLCEAGAPMEAAAPAFIPDAPNFTSQRAPRHCTPLCLAIGLYKIRMINVLIRHGAKIQGKKSEGSSPLHLAAEQMNAEAAYALASHGARLNERDVDGHCPLHVAALKGAEDVIDVLLSAGAKPQALNRRGENALHLVMAHGALKMQEERALMRLLQHEVRVDQVNADGQTPLQIGTEAARACPHTLRSNGGADWCPGLLLIYGGADPLHSMPGQVELTPRGAMARIGKSQSDPLIHLLSCDIESGQEAKDPRDRPAALSSHARDAGHAELAARIDVIAAKAAMNQLMNAAGA